MFHKIEVTLTENQMKLLRNLMKHTDEMFPDLPPIEEDRMLRICLHHRHREVFGEEEHVRILDLDQAVVPS